MDFVFAAYSRRFLISRLKHNLPNDIRRSGARSIRVLWFMHQMGGGWLTFRDLSIIGAGQYKALQYALPDLVKDGLVDEVQTARKNGRPLSRYKINNQGTKVLQVAEAHVLEEYEKAVGRIDTFRNKWDIKSQAR